jgi:hypothetical protein
MEGDEEHEKLREALKRAAVALKGGEVPFALGGSYAGWARGGPEPDHDVDFVIAPGDVERAEAALRTAGLRVVHPPEDWLFKAYADDTMVDILFRQGGTPVDEALLERATAQEVLSVQMPVLSATDILTAKLMAMHEHACDLASVLPMARALREQVEWPRVRAAIAGNDFAEAALFLFDRLHVTGV